MSLTLAILRPALIDKLGLLEIDEMIPTDSLNRAINAGARRMSSEYPWPWLKAVTTIDLVAGTNEYAVPAGAVKILTMSVDSRVINQSSLENMVTFYNLSGHPRTYDVLAGNITFGPTPVVDATATVVYSKLENTLVTDSDTLLTPDHYDDVILTYAGYYQAMRLKDVTLTNSMDALRQEWLRTISRDQLLSKNANITLTKDYE